MVEALSQADISVDDDTGKATYVVEGQSNNEETLGLFRKNVNWYLETEEFVDAKEQDEAKKMSEVFTSLFVELKEDLQDSNDFEAFKEQFSSKFMKAAFELM